jgi:hypothetical protein
VHGLSNLMVTKVIYGEPACAGTIRERTGAGTYLRGCRTSGTA